MISAHDSSKLDAFLRETLKNIDDKFQPFDWSEVEVMLKPRQSSIPAVPINKKNVLIAVAAAAGLILVFGIFKLTQYYSSLPPEPEPRVDSTENILPVLDTAVVIIDSSAFKTDSVKVDSTAIFAAEKRRADSLAALVAADTSVKIKPEVVPVIKAKDKKKKPDTTQKVVMPDTADPKMAVDTAKPAPKEIINEPPAVPDTAKKAAPESSPGKKKKAKGKKDTAQSAEQKPVALPAKPDSLKQ